MRQLPTLGQRYTHYNTTGTFTIISVALDPNKEELYVIARGENGEDWSRTLGNFMGTVSGKPRFRLVEEQAADHSDDHQASPSESHTDTLRPYPFVTQETATEERFLLLERLLNDQTKEIERLTKAQHALEVALKTRTNALTKSVTYSQDAIATLRNSVAKSDDAYQILQKFIDAMNPPAKKDD